jgi:hypothetical protein
MSEIQSESRSVGKKKEPTEVGSWHLAKRRNQFTASLSALPGLKRGTLAALIFRAAPVRGLRPVRAARLLTLNVPKPTKETVSPFFNVFRTASVKAANARVAAALEMSDLLAMCSISSALFNFYFLKMG